MNVAIVNKFLDRIDLYLTLVLPFAMAFIAVLDHSPYATWLIWGGWLFMVLYVLFILVFHQKRIQENKPKQRRYISVRLLVRFSLIMIIPAQGNFNALQDYIYAATAGSALALVLALFIAFIQKALDNTESTKQFGIGLLVFVLVLIGITTYPFAAELIRFYEFNNEFRVAYLIITFAMEFVSIYFIFYEFIKSKRAAIGPDVENPMIFVGTLFAWFFGLGITHAIVSYSVIP